MSLFVIKHQKLNSLPLKCFILKIVKIGARSTNYALMFYLSFLPGKIKKKRQHVEVLYSDECTVHTEYMHHWDTYLHESWIEVTTLF